MSAGAGRGGGRGGGEWRAGRGVVWDLGGVAVEVVKPQEVEPDVDAPALPATRPSREGLGGRAGRRGAADGPAAWSRGRSSSASRTSESN